jgi:hypothetical protein
VRLVTVRDDPRALGSYIAVLLGALVAFAAAPVSADAAQQVRAVNDYGPLGNERLSDEQTITRVATPHVQGAIRSRPKLGAHSVGRLHYLTEDGAMETYLALRSKVDSKQRAWIQIRLPGRPNGRTGWVRDTELNEFQVVQTALRINRTTLKATLYKRGKKIWSSPVGVGAPSTPTPAGHFWVRELLKGDGGVYGPWAFGTSAYSRLSEWPGGGVIGIHGTNEPQLIPGRPSHGCIRMPNAKILRLVKLMPIGTPVRII